LELGGFMERNMIEQQQSIFKGSLSSRY